MPSETEQWMLEAVARIGSEVAITAGIVPISIFQYFGEVVLGIPPVDAAPATGTVTFLVTDDAGYTIEAGTQLDIDGVGFSTDTDLVIAPGDTSGSVAVTAIDTGTAGNDIVGSSIDVVRPSYLFVEGVTLDAATSEGVEGETGEEYADRLADELPTLSPKAILIEDFETLARRNSSVGRALAIDNYNPVGPDPAAEGHVSVVVHDLDGEPVVAGVKSDITETLEGERVLNLSVHVLDPTYTTLDVTFTASAYDDYVAADVEIDAEAAVTAFFDPTTWGDPTFGADTDWIDETTVYRDDLVAVVKNVAGIRHVTALTLGKQWSATAVAATDVVTVTAHGFSANDPVYLTAMTGGAGLTASTTYYVRDVTANTFKLSATPGGAAINITSDLTAATLHRLSTANVTISGPGALPRAGVVSGTVT